MVAIRLEVEIIFTLSYTKFFNNLGPSGVPKEEDEKSHIVPEHITKAKRLINGVITEVLDPNLFYSRMSFMESGRDAMSIKTDLGLGLRHGFQ